MQTMHAIVPLAAACLLIAATAQTQQTTPAPAQPSSAPQPSPPTTLRTNANLVLVDVVVTDHGNAVHGLDKIRFHVIEDGHEQTITSFDEHRTNPPNSDPASISAPLPLPPHTYSNAPSYPDTGAVNVLLLDALNTPLADQMQVRRQMLQYLGKIQPGTSLAIFTLSSRLRLIEGFTTDAAQLAKALQSPKATPKPSVVLDPQSNQTLDSSIADMASMGAGQNSLSFGSSPITQMQQFIADTTAFQTDLRVRMTLDAMQQLARYLSAIPGRKNLIWFSGSFPIALDPDDSLESPFEAMRTYSDEIRETSELLSAARVAVYPVDARGLMTMSTLDASYTPSSNLVGGGAMNRGRAGRVTSNAMNNPSVPKDDANAMKQTMAEAATMQQIAEQTGGQQYINTNGLKEAVASAVENGSSYYTIGYVPAASKLDGAYRKIQIRVDDTDYKLAYRRGYYADATDKPSEHNPGNTSLIKAATLHGAPPATQIQFRVRVLPATDPLFQNAIPSTGHAGELAATLKEPIHRYIADLTIDPKYLAYQQTPDGVYQAQVEFVIVAYDAETRRVNFVDRGFMLKIKAGEYARTLATGIPARLALDLPEGEISLRIAVHDLAAGRAGSLEIPVKVAAQ
jgi:VWFA-related protein